MLVKFIMEEKLTHDYTHVAEVDTTLSPKYGIIQNYINVLFPFAFQFKHIHKIKHAQDQTCTPNT
jgi:hypothetical protein